MTKPFDIGTAERSIGPPVNAGDIVSIAGIYEDGTQEHSETPRALYLNKPMQHFKMGVGYGETAKGAVAAYPLEPVKADGSPDPEYLQRRAGQMLCLPKRDYFEPK